MAESFLEIQAATKCLLDTGEGGDLTLVCKGKEWKVHSIYLWPRSSWFKAACRGGFTESESQQIVFPEEEPSMIYRMLEYLYMQEYTVDLGLDPFWSVNDSWAQTRLHVHAQMYSLGDKYDLPGLKKEAARRFINDTAILGNKKRKTLTLLSVIPTIYTTTPDSDRGLRDLVAQHIFQRYKIASKHFIEELDTALEAPQFARDIIILARNRPAIDITALTKKVHRHLHGCLRTLRTAATSSSSAAAAFGTRVLATRVTLIGMRNFVAIILAAYTTLVIFIMLLDFCLGLFPKSPTKLADVSKFAIRMHCEICKQHDCRMMKDMALTECGGI